MPLYPKRKAPSVIKFVGLASESRSSRDRNRDATDLVAPEVGRKMDVLVDPDEAQGGSAACVCSQ